MRLVNEAGMPSRAWIDRPGHIWVDFWHEGAVYSVDGLTIQFDRGTVWQRDLAVLAPVAPVLSVVPVPSVMPGPPVSARPARNARAAPTPFERAPAGINAFDGHWSVVIQAQSGGCGSEYRYGVQISNGNITTDAGESTSVSGRVLPNGAVSVSVSAGVLSRLAKGGCRLSTAAGRGAVSLLASPAPACGRLRGADSRGNEVRQGSNFHSRNAKISFASRIPRRMWAPSGSSRVLSLIAAASAAEMRILRPTARTTFRSARPRSQRVQ